VIVLAHQIATQKWWQTAFDRFELFVSEVVARECAAGDEEAARQRMEIVGKMKTLDTTPQAEGLAADLICGHVVPETEPEDALHIALAAIHGVQFLATWNCRHIANVANRPAIERICRAAGFDAPVICTPEELLEV
jgi:stage III sporulation protein SpoIIIAA